MILFNRCGRTILSLALAVGAILSPIHGGGAEGGALVDSRDGKKYKSVKINAQTWMAENLNYKTGGSRCYDNDDSNCGKYGRLYDWNTAMKACPEGWHLPSRQEWDSLGLAAGGARKSDEKGNADWNGAGKKLKAKKGWSAYQGNKNGNGKDDLGFSAKPGGGHYTAGFDGIEYQGYWWASEEFEDESAYLRGMSYSDDNLSEGTNYRRSGFSVRCVKSH
jgi:uncharacterized protein (TIGR02145 family)